MTTKNIQLGLKENWKQFTLLVLVNAFVGSILGIERTIFPQFASSEFGISSQTAILSFIVAFGFSKAIANYYMGKLANRYGRKKLLMFGWYLTLPIPFILIYATSWNWVVFANILLGVSQGFAWSSTIIMKIDLVGDKNRGLAMGINEFSGYFAIGVMAFASSYIAEKYGVTPYPFYLGIIISIIGFLMTVFWVKDTQEFVIKEATTETLHKPKGIRNVFMETTFRNKTLSSVTQAGLINNLNDGMIWGLLPILLFSYHFEVGNIGIITAIYPAFWGIGQLVTGGMADRYSKKKMLVFGMLLQGIVILLFPIYEGFNILIILSTLLGIGTALVYPTFLTVIADATTPQQRAESIGVFRLWRDSGYAIGAIISGIVADLFGITYAFIVVGGLTLLSSLILQFRIPREE